MPEDTLSTPSNPEPRAWTVLSRRSIVADRWISLHAERVRTGRGVELDPFYVLDESDWACVVPVLPDGRVVVVEQYRHGAQAVTWELPAGDIDDGESAAQAALRELREETGFQGEGEPILLGKFFPEPARNRSAGQAFLVRVAAHATAQDMEASEDIRVLTVQAAELDAAMDAGRFAHGVHVAALLRARQRGLL